MTLNEFRQAVADDLKGRLPDLRACRPHPGRFNAEELKRLAAAAPGIYIAVMDWGEVREVETEERDLPLSLVAYIVTKDSKGLSRDEAGLNLAEALGVYIPGRRWGLTGVHGAKKVQGQNLYSGQIDRMGVALWAVTWQQTGRLGTDCWDDDGVLPSKIYLGIAPEIGAEHEDDYHLVYEEPQP